MALSNEEKEKQLLSRLKKGHSNAFEELYRLYSPRVYNFAYATLFNKSLAEDITQECFVRIWERRKDIDLSKDFSSYLYRIVRNLVYRESQKQILNAKYISFLKNIQVESANTNEEDIDFMLLKQKIDRLLNELPEMRRKIFVLSRFEGLSAKEIAQKLSISERTVETQIYRTLLFLKDRLKEY